MTHYDDIRARIAPHVDRHITLLVRVEAMEEGLRGAALDDAVSQLLKSPRVAEAKERQLETLTLQVLTEAGVRPLMQGPRGGRSKCRNEATRKPMPPLTCTKPCPGSNFPE